VPAIFVESPKSVLALTSLGERIGRRWFVVGTNGCYGWRRRVGRETTADGSHITVTGPHPDLDRIGLTGREAIICFDANRDSNRNVHTAEFKFASELHSRGARVKVACVPAGPGVNGPDDLVGRRGDDAAFEVIENARPWVSTEPGGDAERQKRMDSAATKLIRLAQNWDLFHDSMGEGFATLSLNGHLETTWINSRSFRQRLTLEFYRSEGKAPSPQSLLSALHTIEAQARFDCPEVEVHTRVAERGGEIYLHLCNADWEAVRITREGWEVVPVPAVKFVRYSGMLPLPRPTRGGSIGALDTLTNLSGHALKLLKGYLLGCLREKIPFPMLAVIGEQDSGKTTLCRLVKSLIDPGKPATRAAPKSEEDLMIAADGCHILALDNLSHIDEQLSDALCRLATGGGLGTRTLYTNRDQTIFEAVRPIVFNSVADVLSRSDLLDRAIVLGPPPLQGKKPEREFWSAFEAARPALLGALCDGASAALRQTDSGEVSPDVRMLDFAFFVSRGENALGLEPGSFIRAYEINRREANETIVDLSPVAHALKQSLATKDEWKGSFTELLPLLAPFVSAETARSHDWPKTARGLSSVIRRLVPNLRRDGIKVEFPGRKPGSGRSLVHVLRVGEKSSQSSQPSQAQPTPARDPPENKEDAKAREDVNVGNVGEDTPHSVNVESESEWEV
jgi:hypothetical protein